MRHRAPPAEGRLSPPPGVLRALVLFHESQQLGAGTSVIRVVDHLSTYGWTTCGWFPGVGPILAEARERLASVELAERPIAYSVRGWRAYPGLARRGMATPAYLGAVRSELLRVRPHVVHANTLLTLPEAMVARSCGLPIVLQVHEIPDPGTKRRAAIRLAARIADVIVAVSGAVAEVVAPHAGRTPILIVRNGVPRHEARSVPKPDGRPFTVGTVGTVSRVKGTDVFLRAAQIALRSAPELRVEHVGAPCLHADAGLDDELAVLFQDPLVRAAVSMRGQQPAAAALDRWDVFVSASRSEAFPLAILEAMAAGLPVVASAVGGVPEQIEHLRTGILVPPDDPQAIATWLGRLERDEHLRLRLGAAAASHASTEFTLAAQAQGLQSAYLRALNLRFGPPPVRSRTREIA